MIVNGTALRVPGFLSAVQWQIPAAFLVFVFAVAPAMSCVMPPIEPPKILIERHSPTDVWITICNYTTFGSEGQEEFCACAFDEAGDIIDIKSIQITDTLCQPIEGFDFESDARVADAVEKIKAGDWKGFLSSVKGYIPRALFVKIKIEACVDAELGNDELLAAVKNITIVTDQANPNGELAGGHQHFEEFSKSDDIELVDERASTGVGEGRHLTTALTVAPNPLRSGATLEVSYALRSAEKVELTILDNLGKTVAVLASERQASGEQKVQYRGSQLVNGMYFVRLVIDGVAYVQKLPVTR